jgi:hypothetical protein
MGIRLFILAAIVLIVFGIIGAQAASGEFLSVAYIEWFMASFLAFLVDLAIGGWGYANGAWGRGNRQGNTVVQ